MDVVHGLVTVASGLFFAYPFTVCVCLLSTCGEFEDDDYSETLFIIGISLMIFSFFGINVITIYHQRRDTESFQTRQTVSIVIVLAYFIAILLFTLIREKFIYTFEVTSCGENNDIANALLLSSFIAINIPFYAILLFFTIVGIYMLMCLIDKIAKP